MQQRSLRIGGSGFDPGTLAGLRARPYDGKIAGLYDMEETLGSGHFAVVKLARHCFTGEKVAVKVIDKSKLDEISKAHLFQEVRCMKLVQHPNVVRLYEVIDTATKLYLILELGDGGDLYDYIMRHETGLSEALAKNYFRQIVLAISYCHKLHVVHRDLKPENVVFFEKLGIVKLTDFGFSNKFCPGQKLETSCGSLAYSAPEILLGDSYDAPAVDIWSLGVILYMLVCGQPPFQEANDSETLTMIMDCKYVVPAHVSPECKDLISQMLVRNPDKRATLEQISKHPWLTMEKDEVQAPEYAPLVTRDQIPEDEHNYIMSKIVNGNMGTTKEEVLEFLDRNEYNNITATYYLLAERRLRTSRENAAKKQRPQSLAVPQNGTSNKNISGLNPVLLSVPRTPGDVPQRSRKCSIVQEDEEEEDVIPTTGREELTVPLNRRGSKSEGRLNLALQERLSDSERRKPSDSTDTSLKSSPANTPLAKTKNEVKDRSMLSPVQSKIMKTMTPKMGVVPTTVITDSSTITIPISTTNVSLACQTEPKYKTMPSPTRSFLTDISNTSSSNSLQLGELGEIFEEVAPQELPTKPSRQFVSRSQNRTTYEQRRSKFNKNRTASCSSSDASDDDSEKRKKRAHKLTTTAKPFQGRRDSHDDSSDSQEPGSSGGAGATGNQLGNTVTIQGSNTTTTGSQSSKGDSRTGGSSNGRQHGNSAQIIIGKRNKCSRRNGETRLRESQSLNRITEVQEDATGTHALVIATSIVGQGVATPKSKGITTRFLDSFKKTSFEKKIQQDDKNRDIESHSHISRKDSVKTDDNKDSCKVLTDRSALKKMKLIGKYFQVHKKLGIPLGFFSSSNTKNRLYKAQSCGSLSRDKVNLNPDEALKCRQRAVSVIRTSAGIEDGDINQNDSLKVRRKSTVVQLNNVCNDLTDICAVHLGQASKCCSFC